MDNRISGGEWCAALAVAEIRNAAGGRPAILVGGTGLYLRALMQGIADIPEIDADIRAETRALMQQIGNDGIPHAAWWRGTMKTLHASPRAIHNAICAPSK